jgi:hypothetical protein
VVLTITGGFHTSFALGSSQTGGTLLPAAGVYGDGANTGISPQNVCINGTSTCASKGFVAGNNGLYWTNAAPTAVYSGSIIYESTTGEVTGGTLAWAGTYGAEFYSGGGGSVSGSYYGAQFTNGSINLGTGARSGTFTCDVGAAGVGLLGANAPLLCSLQTSAIYSYDGQAGSPLQDVRDFSFINNNNGTGSLVLKGNRFTLGGTGNNIEERFSVTVVPLPGAAWLFFSALGLLGFRRQQHY